MRVRDELFPQVEREQLEIELEELTKEDEKEILGRYSELVIRGPLRNL